jgi:starch phosphorylase
MDELAPPTPTPPAATEDPHTGTSVATLQRAFLDHLCYERGRHFASATKSDHFLALAYTVRDRMVARWIDSMFRLLQTEERFVYYLSAEFLMGPQLGNNLVNLGLLERTRQALHEVGIALDDLLEFEEEPGLGNGGLGRLAACYMDSLATLGLPAVGYGIRYEFGMFDQEIRDGWQAEITDKWLRWGNPWEIERPEKNFEVCFGGRTETWLDERGHHRVRWIPDWRVRGVAHDTLVLGGGGHSASLLRLWRAEAMESFDFGAFNAGDYGRAVEEKVASETISKVLYPNEILRDGAPAAAVLRHPSAAG